MSRFDASNSCFALAVIVLSGIGPKTSEADAADGSRVRPEMEFRQPITAQANLGGHEMAVVLEAKIKLSDRAAVKDLDGCSRADLMVATVTRDGKPIYKYEYCSANNVGWAKFHADARGVPYLFLGWREFNGNGANVSLERMEVHALGKNRTKRVAVDTAVPVSFLDQVSYGYRVTAPTEGGLIIDVDVTDRPDVPHCCDDLPKYQRFMLDPE